MYAELLSAFHINRGDIVWLSSDTLKIAYLMKKKGWPFDTVELIRLFQKTIGEEGTLILPVFSYDFGDIGRFDYKNTKGTTGVLGNVALEECGFLRTQHPMHSFAVWGKDAKLLYDMENSHSFGRDSPFGYFQDNNALQVMLGTDYVHAMTFIHYVETMCQVPYRFAKSFMGTYITEDGTEEERTYDYAARDLDVGTIEQFNRIGKILEDKGIASEIDHGNGIISHIVRLGDSFDTIQEDIIKNQCRNIYDFSRKSRKAIFGGYGEIT